MYWIPFILTPFILALPIFTLYFFVHSLSRPSTHYESKSKAQLFTHSLLSLAAGIALSYSLAIYVSGMCYNGECEGMWLEIYNVIHQFNLIYLILGIGPALALLNIARIVDAYRKSSRDVAR
jgi:hypothetical protein